MDASALGVVEIQSESSLSRRVLESLNVVIVNRVRLMKKGRWLWHSWKSGMIASTVSPSNFMCFLFVQNNYAFRIIYMTWAIKCPALPMSFTLPIIFKNLNKLLSFRRHIIISTVIFSISLLIFNYEKQYSFSLKNILQDSKIRSKLSSTFIIIFGQSTFWYQRNG